MEKDQGGWIKDAKDAQCKMSFYIMKVHDSG
jgi:hypothetical protein